MDPKVIAASMADNVRFSQYVIFTLLGMVGGLIIYNIVIAFNRWVRTLTCFNNDNQRYFRTPQPVYAWIKQHILLAPLFCRRHSKQMRIGPAEACILPTRLKNMILFGILIMNVTLATYGIEWKGDEVTLLWHFRSRLGILAITNMIPLVLISGRNNPLILLTRISYDNFNLIHRWFGLLVVALAIAHGSTEFYYMDTLAKQMHKPFGDFLQEERFFLLALWYVACPDRPFLHHRFNILRPCFRCCAFS